MLITLTTFSQEPLKFTGVVKLADSTISASQIYSSCISWFAVSYKDSQRVLQQTDDENYRIIAKALFKTYRETAFGGTPAYGVVNYTIQIDCKDGKFRYEITNFIHDGNSNNANGKVLSFGLLTTADDCPINFNAWTECTKGQKLRVWNELKTQSTNYANELIKDLENIKIENNTINNW